MSDTKSPGVPRRSLITGGLAGGASALFLGSARQAEASGFSPDGQGSMGDSGMLTAADGWQTSAIPTAIAGAQMLGIYGLSFYTFGYATTDQALPLWVASKGCRPSGPAMRLVAPLRLAPGSRIVRLDYYGFRDTAGSQMFWLTRFDPTTFDYSDLAADTASGTGAITVGRTLNQLVQPGYDYVVIAQTLNTEPYVRGVVVQYNPPTGAFYPISPKRVYDSRVSGGRLSDAADRTVSVATELGTANVVVPSGARAVATNLAVTETSGAGFASMRPAGTAWDNTASINWSASGETLSNGVTSTLGGDRSVTVLVGGVPGVSTHFVIDVVGYYL